MAITTSLTNLTNCIYSPNIFSVATTNMQQCDASTRFLKSIFGQPIDVLTAGADAQTTSVHSLITLLIGHFNTGMLTLIIAVYTYMIFHGVISSANEGKFGGREMGHFSFSFRAIIPPAMLIPIKGGFCALQFIIMYCILVGVNLANYVWHESVGDLNQGYVPTTPQAINQAVAQNVAIDFVYDTIANIANAKGAQGATIPGNSIPLWESSYAKAFVTQVTNDCTQKFGTGTKTCKDVLAAMQKYKVAAITYPLAGGLNQTQDQNTSQTFKITVGSSSENPADGLVKTGGSYQIANNLTPDPKTPAGQIGTSLKSVTDFAATSTPITCDSSTCSFNATIDNALTSLIKDENKTPMNPYVDGTGLSCPATWRSIDGMPVSKDSDGKYPVDSTLTKQCYIQEPGGSYVPIAGEKINSSWWYGSRVYLQLNKAMADNIQSLAKAVEKMAVQPQNLVTWVKPKDGSKISVFYGISQFNNTYTQKANPALPNINRTKVASLTNSIPLGTIKNTETNGELSTLPWNKMASCYAPYLTTSPQVCLQQAMGNKKMPDTITVGGTSADQAKVKFNKTEYPATLEKVLQNVPEAYQNPLKLLMIMNLVNVPGTNHTYVSNAEFEAYLGNIITVLQANHLYPGNTVMNGQTGVSTAGEVAPVNAWINRVFGDIMGKNMPGMGTDNGGDTNEKGIFAEIYSLGNTNLSSVHSLVSNSFNTMAHAQRIGLQMINSVTSSLELSYQHINSQMKGDREIDAGIAGGGAAGSLLGGAIGGLFGASSVGTAIAVATQTTLQFTMAKQMFSIGKELAWMPIAMLVLTTLFTAGISFAVILPLTPFFLFWAGQVAWVLAVIEAMVAAPLVVLGLMIPGGHQHFGHIIPGIKMMFAVVFRPVLMVIGLMTGMILTYVLINFSSQGFQFVSNQILKFAGSDTGNYANYANASKDMVTAGVPLTQGIIACLLLFTFCSFMMLAFTKCFSTIYVIPEKVMQWVGGMADKAGQQELQQMSQGMQQSAQSGGQAGGQSGEKSAGANQSLTQSSGQAGSSAISGAGQTGSAVGKDVDAKRNKPAPDSKAKAGNGS